ncbi:hypothetical protein [Intrasporangium sp.]|uniref:hypothetical protein n=1 Tax=Intrasporangium sp. TaxID=1925024 RepID=UPI00322174CF
MILHLHAAVQQLYAARPGQFTSVRSALVAQARAAGEPELARQVGALRRPTVAAWALNHFVREHPDELGALHDFAELLREAQRTLDAGRLRALSRERTRRVDALARKVESAARDAGEPVSVSVGYQIRQSLTAFIADEGAEESVLTGALVRPLQYSGLGAVDLEGVAALAPHRLRVIPGGAEPGSSRDGPATDEPAAAEAAADAAAEAAAAEERRRLERERLEQALARATRELREAERRVQVHRRRVEEAQDGVADLERRLATARQRLEKATGELEEVSGIRDERARAATSARRALEAHRADQAR